MVADVYDGCSYSSDESMDGDDELMGVEMVLQEMEEQQREMRNLQAVQDVLWGKHNSAQHEANKVMCSTSTQTEGVHNGRVAKKKAGVHIACGRLMCIFAVFLMSGRCLEANSRMESTIVRRVIKTIGNGHKKWEELNGHQKSATRAMEPKGVEPWSIYCGGGTACGGCLCHCIEDGIGFRHLCLTRVLNWV